MRLLFGGLIAFILLGLYVYAVAFAIMIVTGVVPGPLSSGFATTMSTVGGLVSALVIAELAVTKPGEPPAARVLISPTAKAMTVRILAGVTVAYLLVWITTGLTAYVVGTLWYPDKLSSLTDLGNAWLGLAVAAAYSYFGIKPYQSTPPGGGASRL